MKLNVSVEMDWLAYDEEGESGVSPDQLVKDAIIKGVMEKISGKIVSEVQSAASTMAMERIDDTITSMLENFLDQPVVITDRYGDPQERHESIKEMMKARFDAFMDQPVDTKGDPTRGCGYQEKTRLQWLLDKHVTEKCVQFMKQVSEQVDRQLAVTLDAEVKRRVSEGLMKRLDVRDILKEA